MRLIAIIAGAALAVLAAGAEAAQTIRIAVQKTGTVAWEIAVIKARGLDKAADLDLQITELASTDAGKIALQGGGADMIVSDWLWAGRERALGDKLLFTPYSTALGAVMAAPNSTIRSPADLAGRSLGVAGGPLDKSWLMLRAAAKRQGVDIADNTNLAYGAPPLVYEWMRQGTIEAALEFWNFAADMEAHGAKRVIDMADVETSLGAKGPVAITGYVFSEAFAAAHKDALKRYFAAAAKARAILAEDASAWAPIKARLKLDNEATFEVYRKRYLEGAPKRPVAEEAADARALYRVLAEIGGKELVGDAPELDPALFYDPQ